jgi:hypothetical protein
VQLTPRQIGTEKMSDATQEITENVANLQLDSVTGEMVSKS